MKEAIARGKKYVHECPDWDYLVIWEGTPEFEACTCEKIEAKTLLSTPPPAKV